MKPRRRLAAVVLIAVTAFCLGFAALVVFRVHRALRQTSAAIDAEENFAVDVRSLNLSSASRFDWIAAPAVFSSGATYQGKLYLCGPSGLYEYSNSGDLLHVYRVGQQLPIAPLTVLAVGTLSDGSHPELLIASSGAGALAFDFAVSCAYCLRHPVKWKRSLSPADAKKLAKSEEIQRLALDRQHGWSAIPSNRYTSIKSSNGVVLIGEGAGHGLGLCQYGSAGMAAEGAGFAAILRHYYPETELAPIPESLNTKP